MSLRLVGAAYEVPATIETVGDILERERHRVENALAASGPAMRRAFEQGLGIDEVRTCGSDDPYGLMLAAARTALDRAGVRGRGVDLIVDYSTLPGEMGISAPLAQRLSADIGAETSFNVSFKFGGCAGFHVALRHATALMQTDAALQVALLVATDSPPPGNRTLLPVTIQGDAGSAVVLRRCEDGGPEFVATEVLTLGHLHRVITLERRPSGGLELMVDPVLAERELMPVYYLHFHRLVNKVLARVGLRVGQVDHFVYSNLSAADRAGFIRAFDIPPVKAPRTALRHYGHTFASDLVVNYTDLQRDGAVSPGQWLLFASAGIGFTWGVSLVRG